MVNKREKRERRKLHIRKRVKGTSTRPRVYIFKSNKYFYAGLADDDKSLVLMGKRCDKKAEDIIKMSKEFAKGLKTKKINTAIFDRSGYKYHGLVKLFREQLKEEGINI